MSDINLLKDMTEAIQAAEKQQARTSAYDTPATVRRIEGDTAWVHITGGVDETPVLLTISCKPGDTVQVRVGGGRAWLVGNATAPPTDDTRAEQAEQAAKAAAGTATDFVTDIRDGIFVHPKNNKADGVRITDVIEILRGGISYVRAYVEDNLAKVRVGRADAGHSVIDSNGMRIFGGDGTDELANIGYGEGIALIGTEMAPYYSLGMRIGTPGVYSMAEGRECEASGPHSHAEGTACAATKQGGHAEGNQSTATNVSAHAEGWVSAASGWASHAEGAETSSGGYGAHAEGYKTTADPGYGAHAEGYETTASGNYGAHSEGRGTTASGDASHAGGIGNTAAYEAQTVIGKYASAPASDDLMLIGNGSSASNRSNAMRLKSSGRVEFAGPVGTGLSWATRTEMVNAVTGLSLGRPYSFYAGSTWTTTAGAGSADAFGVICKTTPTQWQMFFMSAGNVYKSVFNSSTLAFNTTQIG